MAKKKNNSRKALAAALGVVGIAGLSLASASQLSIDGDPENIATGLTTIDAACDDAVTAAFTDVDWNSTAKRHDIVEVTISDIDATACAGKTIEVRVFDDADNEVAFESTTVGAASEAFAVTINGELDLAEIAVSIY